MMYVFFFIMIQSVHLWMAKNFPNHEFREAAFLFPGNELFLKISHSERDPISLEHALKLFYFNIILQINSVHHRPK